MDISEKCRIPLSLIASLAIVLGIVGISCVEIHTVPTDHYKGQLYGEWEGVYTFTSGSGIVTTKEHLDLREGDIYLFEVDSLDRWGNKFGSLEEYGEWSLSGSRLYRTPEQCWKNERLQKRCRDTYSVRYSVYSQVLKIENETGDSVILNRKQ
jgi:hypothetical protein